jgi:solute carrier family 25 (adenine nucleotide translocator) protein 4/5/6/31
MGTLCYPIDTIKRRLMVQSVTPVLSAETTSTNKVSSATKPRIYYRGAVDCFTKILATEGVKGLFSGLSANLIRGFSGAILLVGYDEIKKILAASHQHL